MIREFLPTESPVLRKIAEEVTDFSENLKELTDDMFETLRAGRGVGLAAPQIGISLRIIVFELDGGDSASGEPPIPPTILINPVISGMNGDLVDGVEGCFSVPGYIGTVPRYSEITYLAQDLEGRVLKGSAAGLRARIIQHEIDHLNGVLYVDRASEVKPYER
ncbi:peptide deformylase [Ralstonia solanacearum]|uniref:peptide deformylase n=1 Tax=Ralstonia solanacearum TaxID=305 RepID=UPI003517E2DA